MRALFCGVALAIFGMASLGRDGSAHEYRDEVRAQKLALASTRDIVERKLGDHRSNMHRRVRALYKLYRATWPRMWMEPETRPEAARFLGAARRLLRRDVRELAILREELQLSIDSGAALDDTETLPPGPKRRSLYRPIRDSRIVGRYGEYRDRVSRARLFRRGVELRAKSGRTVRSPTAGEVRYIGEVAGLGTTLIVDHGEFLSVLGRVRDVKVAVGQHVKRAETLGEAIGPSLYVELRLLHGERGVVIDPTELLAR
jgi:murein DD-endopeptidase MepM/ murein hydrolase activator NlpD